MSTYERSSPLSPEQIGMSETELERRRHFIDEDRGKREWDARQTHEEDLRLLLFEYAHSFRGIPEKVHFQVDFGKIGGSDLIFNTRDGQVYMAAPSQTHDIHIGGYSWSSYFKPIANAISASVPNGTRQ